MVQVSSLPEATSREIRLKNKAKITSHVRNISENQMNPATSVTNIIVPANIQGIEEYMFLHESD